MMQKYRFFSMFRDEQTPLGSSSALTFNKLRNIALKARNLEFVVWVGRNVTLKLHYFFFFAIDRHLSKQKR